MLRRCDLGFAGLAKHLLVWPAQGFHKCLILCEHLKTERFSRKNADFWLLWKIRQPHLPDGTTGWLWGPPPTSGGRAHQFTHPHPLHQPPGLEAPELTLLRRKPCSRVGADPCRDSQCQGAVLPDPACQLPCSLYAKFQTLLTPPFDTSVEKDQWQEQ